MKHMNPKRLASIVLAVVLALAVAAPALAADEYKTEIAGKYKALDLAVTVTPNGDAFINPYGLPITLDDDESVISGEQITTGAPLTIANQSAVDLKVGATVTATVNQGSTLDLLTGATNPITATEQGKKVWVNFEAFKAPGLDEDNWDDEDALCPMFAELKSEDAVLTANVKTTSETPATGELVLRKGDDEEIQDGGVAFVRLSGAVAKSAPWTDADGFEVKIVYTFEPDLYTGDVELVSDKTQVADADKTARLEVTLPAGVTSVSNVVWTSSEATYVKAEGNTVSQGKLIGTATYQQSSSLSTKTAKISVTFVGNDGITYKSNEVSIQVKTNT